MRAGSQQILDCRVWVVVLGVGFAGVLTSPGMVDLNHDGMSDIWVGMYRPFLGLDPNADPDHDGFSNLQESIAGTNPFDSSSYPRITAFTSTPTNFSLTFPCTPGKVYQ